MRVLGFIIQTLTVGSFGVEQAWAMAASAPGKLLVLGGSGFVGSEVTRIATEHGLAVTALSRRGGGPENFELPERVEFRRGDASDPTVVASILGEGGYVGIIHTIGMLVPNSLNRFFSGSGSVPDPGATFDVVTRQTAVVAATALSEVAGQEKLPFVFVSAAEAGWKYDVFKGTPAHFLHDYLVAKKAVESHLMESSPKLRPVILRPSLVWSTSRPAALPAVAAFTLGNALGLPFVDKPVSVETLATAAVAGLLDGNVRGIHNWKAMEELAGTCSPGP